MSKNSAIVSIIIWSAVALAMLLVLVFGALFSARGLPFRLKSGEQHTVFSHEEQAGDVGEILSGLPARCAMAAVSPEGLAVIDRERLGLIDDHGLGNGVVELDGFAGDI